MNKTTLFPLLLFFGGFLLMGPLILRAQESKGGVPLTVSREAESLSFIEEAPPVVLPYIDNDAEAARADEYANEEDCESCKLPTYGTGVDITIDLKGDADHRTYSDEGTVWLLKVESEGAYGMQFYFSEFYLPEGAKLFIYNEDHSMQLGAFTSENNPPANMIGFDFGTQYINGEVIYLEYFEPTNVSFSGQLEIGRVIHIFNDMFNRSGPYGSSGPCQKNVACSEGDGWEKEVSAVALILKYDASNQLASICTGTLINNVEENGHPYFLTAKHCNEGSGGPAEDWVFLFNHQTESCSDNGDNLIPSLAGSVFGGFVLAEGDPDYLLMDLNTTAGAITNMGLCFAGWSQASIPDNPFVGIHHPGGDIKKISVEYQSLLPYRNIFGTNEYDYWTVQDWDIGTTEPGSSGSGLFNANHRLVGTLRGGGSACVGTGDNGQSDDYAKFSVAYQNGNFSYYLDPNGTGATYVDTYCPEYTPPTQGPGSCRKKTYRLSKYGLKINGDLEGIPEVCLDSPDGIKLTPHNNCYLIPHTRERRSNSSFIANPCNALQNDDPYHCVNSGWLFTDCDCFYAWMGISITEVDDNLDPIGTEYYENVKLDSDDIWQTIQGGVGTYNLRFGGIEELDLLAYLPIGASLEEGKTYRVVFGYLFGQQQELDEYTRYFRTYTDGPLDFEGPQLTHDLHGGDIIISNTTVDDHYDVFAEKSICILPVSTINAGEYSIEESDCLDFGPARMSSNSAGSNYSYDQSETATDPTEIGQPLFSVYPNPTDGIFWIEAAHPDRRISHIRLMDIQGKTVYQQNIGELGKAKVNCSSLNSGIYLIQVFGSTHSLLGTHKVVLNK